MKIWNLVSCACEQTVHGHRDWATPLLELKVEELDREILIEFGYRI